MKTNTEKMFHTTGNEKNVYQGKNTRALFVCSAGMLRSPTAAKVAVGLGMNARSCGSDMDYALIPISASLVTWADKIYFVNPENKFQALGVFNDHHRITEMIEKKSIVWNIEDDFMYDDPKLIEIVKSLLK